MYYIHVTSGPSLLIVYQLYDTHTIWLIYSWYTLTRSDFSNACFLNISKLLFADGIGTLFGCPSLSFGLPKSSLGLVGVAGGGVCFLGIEGVWCWWEGVEAVKVERMEAADCFLTAVCLGAAAVLAVAMVAVPGGDLTTCPVPQYWSILIIITFHSHHHGYQQAYVQYVPSTSIIVYIVLCN